MSGNEQDMPKDPSFVPAKDMLDETFIQVYSGVSLFTREPFCTIVVDGRQAGQMSPTDIRMMALGWLEAAEAAEMDAMVLAEMTDPEKMGVDVATAGAFIAELRKRRSTP